MQEELGSGARLRIAWMGKTVITVREEARSRRAPEVYTRVISWLAESV